jgi:murein L,D-transpeptidase YafK
MELCLKALVVGSLLLLMNSPISATAQNETSANPSTAEARPDPAPVPPPATKVPLALLKLGTAETFSDYAFVMDKSSRTLTVWKNNGDQPELVSAHPADVGRKAGNKMAVGDYRTPEGIYFFHKSLEDQSLSLDGVKQFTTAAFTTDYPNFFDRLDGKTGNGIWLHAIPDHISLARGSRGCVVVRNDVLKSLGKYIRLDETPIIITDEVKYVDPANVTEKRQQLLTWLENWRSTWQAKQIDKYISFYHAQFSSMGLDRAHWKKFKQSLNDKYSYIKVGVKEPAIYIHQNTAIVRFLQEYTSDKNTDFGEKTLYIRIDGAEPSIVGEEWHPITDQALVKKYSDASILSQVNQDQ